MVLIMKRNPTESWDFWRSNDSTHDGKGTWGKYEFHVDQDSEGASSTGPQLALSFWPFLPSAVVHEVANTLA